MEPGKHVSFSSKKQFSKQEWQKLMDEKEMTKQDLNRLVMNYLVIEGYKDAALAFQEESGTDAGSDLSAIEERMRVRLDIQNGEVQNAVERVNDIDPEILDRSPELYFHLQQQRLIELIRQGNLQAAIEFAQEELAPRGEENPRFLEELEQTMALLAFEDKANSPVGELLALSQRQKTASKANAAILEAQCQEKEPRLPDLLRILVYAQGLLDDKADYPRINDLRSAELTEPVPATTTQVDKSDLR